MMTTVLRWIVRLFPRSFRERYEEEMLQVVLARIDAARAGGSRLQIVKLWMLHLVDLTRTGLVERRQAQLSAKPARFGPRPSLHFVLHDIRHAALSLRRAPAFAAVALVTLALGIGGTTAVFSVINAVLIKPLPYDEPEELVVIWHRVSSRGENKYPQSAATYFTYRDERRAFEDIGLWTETQVSVTGGETPERLDVAVVTDGLLPVLRVSPALGRTFTARDDSPDAPRALLISHAYWQQRFGGDRGVAGTSVMVNGNGYEIIGVLPREFNFFPSRPALFIPFRMNRADFRMGGGFGFQAVARLRPDVTIADANRDVERMIPLTVEKFPAPGFAIDNLRAFGMGSNVIPLKDEVIGDIGTMLWLLMGTVALVLIIACVNVANLFLVRADGRRREVAVRTALGAGWSRIARQFLAESVMLGLVGGAVGLLLAYGGVKLLVWLAPENLPRLGAIGIDTTVLVFAFGISIAVGIAFGLIPIITYHNSSLTTTLKEGVRTVGGGRERNRLRNAFVICQVAFALVLLVACGLMIRTMQELRAVHPGVERPDEILTFRISLPRAEAATPEDAARGFESMLERVGSIPGVLSVGAASAVTLDARSPSYATYVEGFPPQENAFPPSRRYKWVAGDYFRTMGNPVMAGRAISDDDITQRARVVMVTENVAREYWDDPAAAIGKRLRSNPNDPWREIIGVVGNVYDDGVDRPARSIVYWPLVVETFDGSDVFVPRTMSFAIRTAGPPPTSLLEPVRRAVWDVNANLPLADIRTVRQLLSGSLARTSFTLVMLGIASTVAMLLGVVGIYGVISYIVSQRTREIGVRLALGARAQDVERLVLLRGGAVTAVGILIGLGTAAGVTRFMSALLFNVTTMDWLAYTAAAGAVAVVSLLATWIPARRAAAAEPLAALRSE